MLKKILLVFTLTYHLLFAQEEIKYEEGIAFISLTRKAKPLEYLPVNVTTITSEEIKNCTAITLADVINLSPGIRTISYGTLGNWISPSIRHSAAVHTLLLIDGRPVNGISLATLSRLDLTTIPLGSIDRIEILRSANSAAYGANALAGIINVITKKPQNEQVKIDFVPQLHSFDTYIMQMNINQRKEKSGFVVNIDKYITKGWRTNSDYDRDSLFTKLEYDFSQWGKTEISANFLHSNAGIPGYNSTPIDQWDNKKELSGSSPKARERKENTYGYIKHKILLNKQPIEFSFYASNEQLTYTDLDTEELTDKHSINNSVQVGSEIQYEPCRYIVTGITFHQDRIEQKYPESQKDNFNTMAHNIGTFFQFGFGKKMIISQGVRYDNHSLFGQTLNPRFTIVYLGKIKLSINISQGWRAPTFLDLYWPKTTFAEGNKNLIPEKSLCYDFGIEIPRKEAVLKVSTFLRQINELIRWVPKDPSDPLSPRTPTNVAEAKTEGIEVELTHKTGKINHKFNFDSIYNRVKEKTSTEFKLASYSPLYKLNYKIALPLFWGFNFTSTVSYTHEQYSGDDKSGTKLPSFTLLNLRITKSIKGNEFYFGVNNALDTRYLLQVGYPLPGKTYFCGINLQF